VSLQVSDEIIWQGTPAGVSVYNIETGETAVLAGTSAEIWALAAEDGERGPVAEQLALLYGGADGRVRDRVRDEVDSFITLMVEQGLLTERM
jgi:coenzyme PQQ synthesis protein D (PqqD)